MSEGAPATVVCRQCGTALIYPGQTICQHCGGPAKAAPQTASPPAASPPATPPQSRVLWPGQWPPQGQSQAQWPQHGQPQAQWPQHGQAQNPGQAQGQWRQPPPPQQPGPIQPQFQYPQPWQQAPQTPPPRPQQPPWPQQAPRPPQPTPRPAARRSPVMPAILVSLVVAGIVPVAAVLLMAPVKADPSIAPSTVPSPSIAAASIATPTSPPTVNLFPAKDPLTPVGSLKDARSNHTATLLADGRVVILGGISSRGAQAATDYVEIYDPKAKSFGLAGKLVHARFDHTATLLKDGTILLAGGRAQDGAPIAAAEVYNPKTSQSHQVAAMAVPRYEASAVLLDDGRVLIAGGSDANGWILEPEIYDPKTATFTSLGRVSWAVGTVPIVRMGDGRVLVAGGGAAGQATNAAMIYDPKKNRFIGPDEGAGTIEVSRTESTACRLAKSGRILIAGGMGPDGVDATAEIYVMGRYEMGQPEIALVSPRVHHTLTALPDGGALIVGGEAIYGQPTASIERWKPNASATTPVGTMSLPRSHHTATLLKDGTVLIAGGRSSLTTVLADAAIFRP